MKASALSPAKLRPMEARLVSELPKEGNWQFEPKWDGFRCLAFRNAGKVELRAKSGKPLTRYFPEMVAAFRKISSPRFILDGELLIPQGKTLSFASLQMRLHPAQSRIDKLSKETPALFMAFDILQTDASQSLLDTPFGERREELEQFARAFARKKSFRLSPFTRNSNEAKRWLQRTGAGALDGVVAKSLDETYRPAERMMLKIKCLRTADCVVGGFRYATDSKLVGSLLLGLFNKQGKLDHVGFTSGIAEAERAALTRKVERLKGGEGFTGSAPGGPSRWSTERSAEWEPLKPRLVAEVRYDHITANRFRHGTKFLRWRPDKAPQQCTFAQLQRELRPSQMWRVIQAP